MVATKAITYTKHDLPFPREHAAKLVSKWSRTYMACLFDWVATLDNPWQANSHPDFLPMVKATWDFVFPGLGDDTNHPAIEFLVCFLCMMTTNANMIESSRPAVVYAHGGARLALTHWPLWMPFSRTNIQRLYEPK